MIVKSTTYRTIVEQGYRVIFGYWSSYSSNSTELLNSVTYKRITFMVQLDK